MKRYVNASVVNIYEEPLDDRLEAAKDPHTNPSLLMQLAFDTSSSVRFAVSRNPAITEEILEVLSNDEDADVVCEVVHNDNATYEMMLRVASKFPDYFDVWDGVINTHACEDAPYELFETLYLSNDYFVWDLLADANAGTPSNILLQIAKRSRDYYTIIKAIEHDNFPNDSVPELVDFPSPWTRAGLAYSNKADADILDKLSHDGDSEVRRAVASSNRSTADILDYLSRDSDDEVRMIVASNHNTSISTLKRLSEDSVSLVVNEAVFHLRNLGRVE